MVSEILSIGAGVSTAAGALGLVILAALFAYYRYLRNEEITLKEVPSNQRARLIDRYLTRYRVDASGLTPDNTYELIRLELEKRAARVTLITIVISGVFLVSLVTVSIAQLYSGPGEKPIIPGDLTPIIGQINGVDRIRNIPRDKNTGLLNQWISTSQKNIKIVTINGSSWIPPNHLSFLQQAMSRIPVTIMLLDYTDKRTLDIWNDTMSEYGESIWPRAQFEDNFLSYAKLLTPQNHLTVGLYNNYPWSRFTIFDDRAVSFIITPDIEAGDKVITYFSQDAFVVKCFEYVFEMLKSDASKRERIFTEYADAKHFLDTEKRVLDTER